MGPSFDPAMGAGLSDDVMSKISSLSADYHARLKIWSMTKNEVDAQVAAVRSAAVLFETIAGTILPLVTQMIEAHKAKAGVVHPPGVLDTLKGELLGSLKSSLNVKSILQQLLGGLGLTL